MEVLLITFREVGDSIELLLTVAKQSFRRQGIPTTCRQGLRGWWPFHVSPSSFFRFSNLRAPPCVTERGTGEVAKRLLECAQGPGLVPKGKREKENKELRPRAPLGTHVETPGPRRLA